ncbi:hypothetical protein BDV96DRAFT_685662 [Lophiotrema nucula]|uniref:F-box domain-containing protein n=1 Tax=Lophiotrema nucula TaxID=690887 RepID=A0A6A5ZFN8_9PLEO|nr:hypothetical protein BDV96DRAFT_685662 [Lophiotrema nucula]
MELLDVPPELLENIIHLLVEQFGIAAAWRLRLVCKTFADHVSSELEKNHHMKEFSYGTYRCKVGKAGLDGFLLSRMVSASDCHPAVPTAIHETAEYLATFDKRQGVVQNEVIIHDIAERLCKVVASRHANAISDTVKMLGYGYDDSSLSSASSATSPSTEQDLADRLVGSAVIGNQAAIDQCLSDGANLADASRVFGYALSLTATHGNHAALHSLLQRLPRKINPRIAGHTEIQAMLYNAIISSLLARKFSMAITLSQWYAEFVQRVPRQHFNHILTAAIMAKHPNSVEAILLIKVGTTAKVTPTHIEDSVRAGSVLVFKLLLRYFEYDKNSRWSRLLSDIIKCGRPNLLKALLERRQRRRRSTLDAKLEWFLTLAKQYHRFEMVKILRQAGAEDSLPIPYFNV